MNTDFSLLLFQFPKKVLPPQPRPSNQCDVLFSPSSSYIVSFWAVAAKSWLSQKPIQERHPLANSIGSNPFSSDHFNIGRGLFQDPTMGSSVTTRSKVQFRKIELPILDLFIPTVSLTFVPKWSTCEKLQFPGIFHIQDHYCNTHCFKSRVEKFHMQKPESLENYMPKIFRLLLQCSFISSGRKC